MDSSIPWHAPNGWATKLFAPTITTILGTLAVAILLPILVHIWLYRTKTQRYDRPEFLVLGVGNSGKTSLVSALERSRPISTKSDSPPRSPEITATCPSQESMTIQARLPSSYTAYTDRLRSTNDPESSAGVLLKITDTPGERKLRYVATKKLVSGLNISSSKSSTSYNGAAGSRISGIIFVVNAAAMEPGSTIAQQTADYLHDILLVLEKRYGLEVSRGKGLASGLKAIPVLVVANKADVFTAQAATTLQDTLEREIEGVRVSRGKALGGAGRSSGLGEIGSVGGRSTADGFNANSGSEDAFLAFLNLSGDTAAVEALIGADHDEEEDGGTRFSFNGRKGSKMDVCQAITGGGGDEYGDGKINVSGVWKWIAKNV